MQNATVSVLTALHALSHRIALTDPESFAIEAAGAPLTPQLWEQTVGLLMETRGRAGPVDLDLGFTEFIFVWLGVPHETGFRERFGIGLREALSADAAQLYRVARAVDSPQCPAREAVRCQITVTWCDRANLLLAELPENAAAAVEALEAALLHCPPEETWHARLYEALARAAAVTGDRSREVNARERLAALRAENGPEEDLIRIGAARVLSILWCRAHRAYQLAAEHGLDPHVPADPSLWQLVRDAIDAGRLCRIPIPAESFVAWSSRPALADRIGSTLDAARAVDIEVVSSEVFALLEAAGSDLAELVPLVESVWSGTPAGAPDTLLGRYLAAAVAARRRAIEDGWHSLPGQPRCPWLEIFQGPHRDATVERVALMELLHPVLARSATYDVATGVLVAMDQAASASARGDWAAHEDALRHAVCLTGEVSSTSPWFGYGRVWCALYTWRCGDADGALDALDRIETRTSTEATAIILSKSDARRVADGLDERWRAEPSLDTGSRAAWAHHEAGHFVRARELASGLTCRWPEDGAAWAVLAGLLCAQSRYRDAQAVAGTALERGYDLDQGQQLLERVQRALSGE